MNDLRETNLKQLTDKHLDDTANAGAVLLDTLSDAQLAVLLRSHWIEQPTDAEIRDRDAVDCIIDYYSMLEVASVAGCVPDPLPDDLRVSALKRLTRPAVARYYINFYPLLLPKFFTQRVKGGRSIPSSDSYPEFARFLHVSALITGEPIETFLWFLDDGSIDGVGLEDVVRVFADADRLVEVLATPLAQHTALHRGVRGAMTFLKFGRELDALLLTLEAKPDLQSAFWHYRGYWFQQLGIRVSGIIMAVIETFREQVGAASDPEEARLVEKTRTDMNLAQDSMLRLTSGIYSVVLERRWLNRAEPETVHLVDPKIKISRTISQKTRRRSAPSAVKT